MITHHGHSRYLVDCRPTGKRELWDNPADALAAAERIAKQRRNEGASSFAELSPSERRDAAEALALLDGEATLLDAARAFVTETSRRRELATVPTVSAAIDQYLDSKRQEFAKGEFSKLSLFDVTSKLRIVREALGRDSISALDEATVTTFLNALPHRPIGKKNILTKVNQLLNYAVRQRWIPSNPARGIKVRVKQKDVDILSVDQVRRLLTSCHDEVSGVFPFLSLQLFAGLRPHEASQMRWEYLHFETSQIEVRAATSKTRESRFVPMNSTLVEMLLSYRRLHGPIIGARFDPTLREVKTAAGFGPSNPWPKDVLRHCFGSYWLAVHMNRAELAEVMGNSVSVIKRHYRRAIPETVAAKYWTLALEPAKIVEFPSSEAASG